MRLSCDPTIVEARLDGREQPVNARVVEVSKSGVQLLVAESLPIGAHVRVEIGAIRVEGDIRHCKQGPDENSWAVGILMHDVSARP
jgi:hypothetical protein